MHQILSNIHNLFLKRNRASQRGYSLVELLVSGVILGLVVIAVTSMIRSQANLDESTNLRRQALDLLTEVSQSGRYHPISSSSTDWSNVRNIDTIACQLITRHDTIAGSMYADMTEFTTWRVQGLPITFKMVVARITWRDESITETAYITRHVINYPH